MLANLIELPPDQLAEHVPAIAASLDHEDEHVRNLAISMLGRLEKSGISDGASVIAERLGNDDVQVRLAVVRALGSASPAALAVHADALAAAITDEEPAVRWAIVDALGNLDAEPLGEIMLSVIDTLLRQHDASIARAAVSNWSPKLKASSPAVLEALVSRVRNVELES